MVKVLTNDNGGIYLSSGGNPILSYDEGDDTVSAKTHVEKKLIRAAGNAYGIRYGEALALECAYQRWKLEQLERKLKERSL